MLSTLAGSPYFLAHNLLLPFLSCCSWGAVVPRLLSPFCKLVIRAVLFFVLSAFPSYIPVQAQGILFAGIRNEFLPGVILKNFKCQNTEIISHCVAGKKKKICALILLDFLHPAELLWNWITRRLQCCFPLLPFQYHNYP